MADVLLEGLDGSNPLAFFAALGTLRALDETREPGAEAPRLSWDTTRGRPAPTLHGPTDVAAVIDRVIDHQRDWVNEPALRLAYAKGGGALLPEDNSAVRDLKPPPDVMRAFLETVAALAAHGRRRSSRAAAAYATEHGRDNNGNTKPTALHFTAGQQTFLAMVAKLQESVSRTDIEEALRGPWSGKSKLPSLSWDASVSRLYALRATNPADEKRGSVPGADWLAFVGLASFPVASAGSHVVTTGVRGGWKDAEFSWPIWSAPATLAVVESLLRWDALVEDHGPKPVARRARGVERVYRCAILRSDQGGYGSFAPARVV